MNSSYSRDGERFFLGAPVQTARATLTASAVTSLKSNPLTLVPATPGYTIWPVGMVIEKEAGAFTIGAATVVRGMWAGLGFGFPYNIQLTGGAPATQIIGADAGAVLVVNAGAAGTGSNTWTGLTGNDRTGLAFVLALDNDMTPGGGAPWHVYLEYVKLKNTGW